MKTAVSLPDALFEEIDACARALRMTRSGLLAKAARDFVARHRGPDPTQAWNDAIDAGGQPGNDPAARAFRRRTAEVVHRGSKGRR
jgi:predicted transcriptional regulator